MRTLLIVILLMSSSAMAQNYINSDRYAPVRTDRNNPVGREISEGRDYLKTMKQQNQRYNELDNALTTRELINGGRVGESSGRGRGYDYYGY